MLKISYAFSFRRQFPAISAKFTVKMCVAAQNREKFTKTLILGVTNRLRSSIFILLKNSSPVFVDNDNDNDNEFICTLAAIKIAE